MTPEQELEKEKEKVQMASYAQQVVNNPAYKAAMALIRGKLLDEFNKLSFKDIDDLQEIKRRLSTVEGFQSILESTMRSGKIAEEKVSRLSKFINKIGIR